MVQIAILFGVVQAAAAICFSQAIPTLQTYCKGHAGLNEDQSVAFRTCRGGAIRRSADSVMNWPIDAVFYWLGYCRF
jgi:hypothetical protein